MDHATTHDDGHAHDAPHHEELGFWRKYIFSTDHKVIGIQYGLTSLIFLFFGFSLMMLMRWQLAYPGQPLPYIGWMFSHSMPGGVMTPDFYNALGAMHGTIMVFLGIVPLAFGAFGNYVVPLQIGAPDMAFPKLNAISYWAYLAGGLIMLISFFVPGGAANAGWTAYPPLSVITTPIDPKLIINALDSSSLGFLKSIGEWLHHSPFFGGVAAVASKCWNGQSLWLIGMILLITSSLLGSVNFIVTIIQLRCPGMTWMRLPFFCWAQLVTAFLLLLAFPPLEAAGVMQLMDRVAGTSFFLPEGLNVSYAGANVVAGYTRAGGGSPLLWQHLFWFLGHPEVYVLILPGLGIICEVITNNTRKPIWGYRSLVYSTLTIGFLSFTVWAHHMYLTGMGTKISAFFQTTTMMISIPSVIILTAYFISLWGGSIRFTTPMMFAMAFLPMFGIGGLTGLPLGFNASDIHLHDTYYVIAHFHYVVAPGTIFAMFAGIYYWYPKATGRMLNEKLGHLHFWGSLITLNGIFFPMFIQGMAGVSRRLFDGGTQYLHAEPVLHWNEFISISAWGLGIFQIPFIINFFWSIWKGRPVANDNPWDATTMEWQTPTPPPHGNFLVPPVVKRGPYEYSVPGEAKDYTPQNQ
ncbi:MAG: cbb3-type cytochrome c oxidase subunit I [Verrucomicrobiota bacterium]|nr:cbb3-type cytochrome c oxidase subunit I [Verrucomicrobiota bacterium]